MKNLTPEHMRCPFADCPGVYELADGRLLIVGVESCAPEEDISIGPGETAVIIDRALLADVKC